MMQINGITRTCGLIGNPVAHTLSPIIHNNLAEKCNRNLVYVPFLVENDNLSAAVKGAYALQVLGLNVTVPYKEKVMNYLSSIDALAKEINAVNTLVYTEDGYKGYNTDILGLRRAMKQDDIIMEGKTVCILGAGGAAKAAAVLAVKEKAAKIYILNRTIENAAAMGQMLKNTYGYENVVSLKTEDHNKIEEQDIVAVQCTSVGLHPNDKIAVIEEESFYKKVSVGLDIIYNPETTKFMSYVKEQGGRAYNGLKMLLYQGIIAFELWTDTSIDEETASWIYEKMKTELNIHG